MQLYIDGMPSIYETENVTRLFLRQVTVTSGFPRAKDDIIVARAGKYRLLCAVRSKGQCLVRTAPAAAGEEQEFALLWSAERIYRRMPTMGCINRCAPGAPCARALEPRGGRCCST